MKFNKIKTIFTIIFLLTIIIGNAKKNYELYSIEEATFLCVSADNKTAFYIEEESGLKRIIQREIPTGKIVKTFKTKINKIAFDQAIASNQKIYFSTYKEIEGERYRYLGGVYSIDLKKQKIKTVFVPKEKMRQLEILGLAKNSLVFHTMEEEKSTTLFYNIENKKITDLNINNEYYVLFVDPERNGMCLLQRPEDDAAPDDLYFCDFSANNKLTKLGQYQSDAVYSSNPEENKYPYSIITDEQYKWFDAAYNKNRFPTAIMRAADYTEFINAYQSLNNYEYITAAYLVDKEFFIGMLPGKKRISVYNIKTPLTQKKSNLTKEQTELINAFIDNKISYEKTKIVSEELASVFLANFYKLNKITKNEYGSSKTKYLIGEFKGEYDVIKSEKQLTYVINPDFKINSEANALVFEKALDTLYPLGVFDEKEKEHFKKENIWYFVRGESFGEKKAISVLVKEDGSIEKINRLKEITIVR